MTIENVLSALGLLGLGGALGTYLRIVWERRNTALLKNQDFKDKRYKCMIMLMYTALDFGKRGEGPEEFGRNFQSPEDVIDELKAEWHNAILFASEALSELEVVKEMPHWEIFSERSAAKAGEIPKSICTFHYRIGIG